MSEKGTLVFGNTNIDFSVIRSDDRRKSISISVDPYDGVFLRAPVAFSNEKMMALLRQKAPWIIQKQKIIHAAHLVNPPKEFVSGETFLYRGRQYRLKVVCGVKARDAGVKMVGSRILVRATGSTVNRKVVSGELVEWYKGKAFAVLRERVKRYSNKYRFPEAKVIIAGQTKRWGSCSNRNELRFNWRIVMAPTQLIDYVVVHELCHLKHKNHSPAFWHEVATIIPNYEALRARLKKEGFAFNFQ